MSEQKFTLRIQPEFLRDSDIPTTDVIHRLLLYDFETGRSDLHLQHRAALDRYVVPYINGGYLNAAVFVGGMASRVVGQAPAEFNSFLAFNRARSVVDYLEYRSTIRSARHTLVARSYGAKRSVGGSENAEFHRAVLVVLARAHRPAVRIPPPARPLPLSNRFEMRLAFGYEGGEVVGFGSFRFEIDYDRVSRDSPEHDPTQYHLLAIGGTVGAPGGGSASATWNPFSASRMCTPRDFEGRAAISSFGASYARGVGVTTVHLYPEHGSEIMIDNFQTDVSFSAGGSILYGPFLLGWGH